MQSMMTKSSADFREQNTFAPMLRCAICWRVPNPKSWQDQAAAQQTPYLPLGERSYIPLQIGSLRTHRRYIHPAYQLHISRYASLMAPVVLRRRDAGAQECSNKNAGRTANDLRQQIDGRSSRSSGPHARTCSGWRHHRREHGNGLLGAWFGSRSAPRSRRWTNVVSAIFRGTYTASGRGRLFHHSKPLPRGRSELEFDGAFWGAADAIVRLEPR